jgi:gluconate 2-dehydrogenase
MEVNYHQRTPHTKEMETSLGIRFLGLDELISGSDYVVLVIPYTPDTEGIIGAAQLARMKPGSTIINVGRGGLIDEDALARALQKKEIAMAGLDVYRQEPLPESSLLRHLPNVVLLPHTGGGSNYWNVDLPATLSSIQKFFQGEQPHGVINPT